MYTAIIIEPRNHPALEFVLQNALECLPNNWKIIFFHGIKNKDLATEVSNRLNQTYENRLQIVNLNIDNLNQKTYSELLATKSCVYEYIKTEYFLVFQTDSMIFKENANIIAMFISEKYDYVGSPWKICNYQPTLHRNFIGNGGLSLRKTTKMLEIIEKYDWRELECTEFEWLEDLYFTNKYSDINIKKPPYEKAKLFSVDEVFSKVTFGCHKPWMHTHYADFMKIYPEVDNLRMLQ